MIMGKHLDPTTWISVDFDIICKFYGFDIICKFYGKYCVRINKYVFVIIKIKYVNSDKICDICNKINFTTKLHIFYNIRQIFYQNIHKYYYF